LYQSHPIETAIAAERAADLLNAGKDFSEAFKGLEFINGRYYLKRG
jgi:hypothetical protein